MIGHSGNNVLNFITLSNSHYSHEFQSAGFKNKDNADVVAHTFSLRTQDAGDSETSMVYTESSEQEGIHRSRLKDKQKDSSITLISIFFKSNCKTTFLPVGSLSSIF